MVSFAQSAGHTEAVRVLTLADLQSPIDWSGVDLVIFDRADPPVGALPPVASVSLGTGLRPLGVALTPAPAAAARGADRVVSWKRDHPLMRDVALDALVLDRPATLALPARAIALADGVRGPLIGLIEGADGVGHAVTSLTAQQGGWGADLSFVVFMGNTMDYLTLRGRGKAGRQFATGETLSAVVSGAGASLSLVRPDGARETVVVGAGGERRAAAVGVADRVGVYTVSGAADGVERFAVNLSSVLESRLATNDTLPIRARGVAAASAKSESPPREVWDWFVMGAIGVLALEWLLFAALVRR
ncbi:MAG: hypothetical protein QM783_08435 [Phycisphaerales bacterium]